MDLEQPLDDRVMSPLGRQMETCVLTAVPRVNGAGGIADDVANNTGAMEQRIWFRTGNWRSKDEANGR